MDLNVMINDSLAQLKEEGFVEKVVSNQLRKTIEGVVQDSLRQYSTFGETLEKKVKELLQINLDNLDIPSYNYLIVETIKDHLNTVIHEQGLNRMKEQLDNLLLTFKAEVKLSELIKQLAVEAEDLDELGYEEAREMTLIVNREFTLFTHIYFDAKSDVAKNQCKYKVSVDGKTGEVESIRIRDNNYMKKGEFKEFDVHTIMGGFYGLEKTLFKMYARKAVLIMDEDDVELQVTNPDFE